MKPVIVKNTRSFPHTAFSVVAIIVLIAVLFATFDVLYDVVQKGADAVGIALPPKEVWKEIWANVALAGVAVLMILIGGIIAVPIIKVAVIVAGVAIAAAAIFNVWKWMTGEPAKSILPGNDKITKK